MGEIKEVLDVLQAGSAPVLGIIAYLLWKLDRQMSTLKTSIDTLVEAMVMFVPGFRERWRDRQSSRRRGEATD